MIYDVIASSSYGNATVIENTVLIDCGMPYKAISKYVDRLKIVLLTHSHKDHFNKKTIARLSRQRPMLRFGCGKWLVLHLLDCGVSKANIDVYDMDVCYNYKSLKIIAFKLFHNVPNCGYKLMINHQKAIYATDTNRIETTAKNYDLYLIEANYGDKEIQQRIRNKRFQPYIYELGVLKNHLSESKAFDFIMSNAGPNSRYRLMHQHAERKKAN